MNQAFSELKKNFLTGKTRSIQWRVEQLVALKQILEKLYPEIERAKKEDLGMSEYTTLLTCKMTFF